MTDGSARATVLAELGATPAQIEELLAYNDNHFHPERIIRAIELPLEPEAHVSVWDEYAAEVRRATSIEVLGRYLPQFCFPIRSGMSEDPRYRAATERGEFPAYARSGLTLKRPRDVRLIVHEVPAGRIPVFVVPDREDFVALVQALGMGNEPCAVGASQGACMVEGFENWDRLHRCRRRWQADHEGAVEGEWQVALERLRSDPTLYQDRFIIVSEGPYSAVPASAMGLSEDEWRTLSLVIRLEHEFAHYFTRRVFDSMENRLHDEIMADWAGITAAHGHYRADWFLQFMGLDALPSAGGRLRHYRGTPPLSDGAFAVLQGLVRSAAVNLERFTAVTFTPPVDSRARVLMLLMLARLTLEEIGSRDGPAHLERARSEVEPRLAWRGRDSPDTSNENSLDCGQ